MFKLMKYELRKQLFSKIIILITLGILECIFMYGVFTEKESAMGLAIGLFSFLAIAATVFVSFECIATFSNDLKTKQSYMLFLTPNSTYKIVGAKVLTSIAQIILTGAAFAAVIILNVMFLAIRFNEIDSIIKMIQEITKQILGSNLDLSYIISILFYMVLSWISVVTLAMLSITLSSTFLANSKLKGFVSVAIFFALNYVIFKIYSSFLSELTWRASDFFLVDVAVLVVVGATYFATAWMLDKKVSV